jgi:two-component system chemotaxis response regulator CheY
VLIADDSKAMRMIVLRTLRQSGIPVDEVHEAADGAEALAAVGSFGPDLILSDWNMPNKTGIEFLIDLRATGSTVPFGFVTSESNPAMKEQAIAAGAQFLLCKPFNADQFEEVVAAVVR